MSSSNGPYDGRRPAVAELAAGAVLRWGESDEMLLLHHAAERRWCLPKGHVEAGESVPDAAIREVREESGIRTIQLERELGQIAYRFYDSRKRRNVFKTTVYWLARTAERRVHPEDLFDDARWVTAREAHRLLRYPEERQLLEGLLSPRRSGRDRGRHRTTGRARRRIGSGHGKRLTGGRPAPGRART